jgi:heptosyltransferase-2/heptosyltransferase-3
MHAVIPGARLMLCGAAREEGLLHDIRREANVDCIEIAAADLPLRRALAVMEIAHSMVAVDTGPAHIAAAVGCPLVVLYGAESPQVWGRRSVMNRPVIEIGGPPELQAVGQISLDRVLTAWLSIAHRTHDGSRRSSSCVSTASNFA